MNSLVKTSLKSLIGVGLFFLIYFIYQPPFGGTDTLLFWIAIGGIVIFVSFGIWLLFISKK